MANREAYGTGCLAPPTCRGAILAASHSTRLYSLFAIRYSPFAHLHRPDRDIPPGRGLDGPVIRVSEFRRRHGGPDRARLEPAVRRRTRRAPPRPGTRPATVQPVVTAVSTSDGSIWRLNAALSLSRSSSPSHQATTTVATPL